MPTSLKHFSPHSLLITEGKYIPCSLGADVRKQTATPEKLYAVIVREEIS